MHRINLISSPTLEYFKAIALYLEAIEEGHQEAKFRLASIYAKHPSCIQKSYLMYSQYIKGGAKSQNQGLALLELGKICLLLGKYEEAEARLIEASREGQEKEAFLCLSQLCYKVLQQPNRAAQYYERYLERVEE